MSLLNKLDSNEAVLLMYLAEELPAEDRAEVEQMLAGDGALREQLECLRQVQSVVSGHFAIEQQRQAFKNDEAVVRRTLREMRRHKLESAARPAVEGAAQRWRLLRNWPRWAYPAAAAAAVLFVLLGLWGVGVINLGPDLATRPPSWPQSPDDELLDSFVMKEDPALDEATRHAADLQADDEDDGLLLML